MKYAFNLPEPATRLARSLLRETVGRTIVPSAPGSPQIYSTRNLWKFMFRNYGTVRPASILEMMKDKT